MELVPILFALVLAFLAFKFITGVIKYAVIATVLLGALYFAGVIG